jgi:hypothetical protein
MEEKFTDRKPKRRKRPASEEQLAGRRWVSMAVNH